MATPCTPLSPRALPAPYLQALTAKLVRDFNVPELDRLRAAHLPWTPAPGGTKATRAAELADWISEHAAEYLEQQGAQFERRRQRYGMFGF